MNRSIVEKARTFIRLRKEYWPEAVGTAAFLLNKNNRSPIKRFYNKTPYEAMDLAILDMKQWLKYPKNPEKSGILNHKNC